MSKNECCILGKDVPLFYIMPWSVKFSSPLFLYHCVVFAFWLPLCNEQMFLLSCWQCPLGFFFSPWMATVNLEPSNLYEQFKLFPATGITLYLSTKDCIWCSAVNTAYFIRCLWNSSRSSLTLTPINNFLLSANLATSLPTPFSTSLIK